MVIGLKGGAHADAVFFAKYPDGRELVADLEGLVADELFEAFGYLKIEGVVAGKFGFRHAMIGLTDLVKDNKSASVFFQNLFRNLHKKRYGNYCHAPHPG